MMLERPPGNLTSCYLGTAVAAHHHPETPDGPVGEAGLPAFLPITNAEAAPLGDAEPAAALLNGDSRLPTSSLPRVA